MSLPNRNAPCPCGSGKKYKKCCLKAAREMEQAERLEAGALTTALSWLDERYSEELEAAMALRLVELLGEERLEGLSKLPQGLMENFQDNLHEWLVAEGELLIGDELRSCRELLLEPGGPLLDVVQRQWLEKLWREPLGLYEVESVQFGKGFWLQDKLATEEAPAKWVEERMGSQQITQGMILGARLIPGDSWRLSGAVFLFPQDAYLGLRADLLAELTETPDEELAREILGTLISEAWFDLLVPPLPQVIDRGSGQPLLLVTDHYEVLDWDRLEKQLAEQADVTGDREQGWDHLESSEEGPQRILLSLKEGALKEGAEDRLECFAPTLEKAKDGRKWVESVAGETIKFITREMTDPVSVMGQQGDAGSGSPIKPPFGDMPPGELGELFQNLISKSYEHWADEPIPALGDKTPRQAIATEQGLEAVVGLLHSYEKGEQGQAKDQDRPPVSYDFLWRELGLEREDYLP